MLTSRIADLPAETRARLVERLRTGSGARATGRWFSPQHQLEHPGLRLFAFSYAGGGASVFRSWAKRLPPGVELWTAHLPGREQRSDEPPFLRMESLVDALKASLEPHQDRPYAFFGHSMGALVAFALTRRLRQANRPLPRHLFLAGFRAPQLPNPNIKIHHMPDEVIKTVLRKDGTPQAVLDDQELMDAFLPTLRADLECCDTYRYTDEPPLDVPMSVFGGDQDVRVGRRDLEQWRSQTRAEFELAMFPGSHFFIHQCQDQLLSRIHTAIDSRTATRHESVS
ncbi:MAG: thioesterase II family protein [Pseudonocardia sp.]